MPLMMIFRIKGIYFALVSQPMATDYFFQFVFEILSRIGYHLFIAWKRDGYTVEKGKVIAFASLLVAFVTRIDMFKYIFTAQRIGVEQLIGF